MKKNFVFGYLCGIILSGILLTIFEPDKERLFYEKELSDVEGYKDLSEEEKNRVKDLKGKFEIGEMAMYSHTFNYEGYDSEADALTGKKIIFRNINNVELLGEHYQVERIQRHDARYYWGLRYVGALLYLGEKSVIEMGFRSLDSDNNSFDLLLTANGNVFLIPGARSDYGDFYVDWGIYIVFSHKERGAEIWQTVAGE